MKLLDEIHPHVLVILSPFGIQFSLESVESVERVKESCVQIRVVRERRLKLRSQGSNLENGINVGRKVGLVDRRT